MSHKSELQIYLAKRGFPPPIYETTQTDTTFVSTLCIFDQKYTGLTKLRKRDAENSVACVALEFLVRNIMSIVKYEEKINEKYLLQSPQ